MQVLIQVAGLVTVVFILFSTAQRVYETMTGFVCRVIVSYYRMYFLLLLSYFFIIVAEKSQFVCVFYDTISVLCSFFVYRNTNLKYCNSEITLLYTFPVGRPTINHRS